ncbi:hypothetical protein [Acinetobacter lwoffii]|jgi:hypothetical protein|uniref:hypothetical protein n=1 Tax=Acinetobacter lwoffii TaxID=28090 RepID=UPI0013E0C9BD|nr:hypothetical protein [Acinetobacter lwoffii]MCJ0926948.1 hypothetical protein [Acinetobacter lwoffii]MCO8083972.1 hypothetical protein [Acinetobacter lwoffii]MCU4422347.1 hypothetical protein [Acinetobacter lwoffii]NGP43088.1 hypothetical protein [Acinetobacter lwoffii]
MNIKTPIILTTALMLSVPAFAQTTTQSAKPVKPYGENPNLLHVFAYKAQEGVINTAEKVGEATEKGIAKIKPGVDRAWSNTKSATSDTLQKVDQGATQAAQQTGQKIQQTKEVWRGNSQQAPIVQQPLSESSTTPQQTTTPQMQPQSGSGSATSYAVTDL